MKLLNEYVSDNDKIREFIADNKDLLIKVAAVMVVIVAAFLVFALQGESREAGHEEKALMSSKTAKAKVFVDIGGEVKTPMLAELAEGCRVEDAIEAAGGLTENADLTDINRAAFLNDGDKIFIPSLLTGEALGTDGFGGAEAQNGENSGMYADGRININTADSMQLQELTGIGPVTAEKIISYREENGRFSSIEDIKNVSGIGDKTYEKFKDDIRV